MKRLYLLVMMLVLVGFGMSTVSLSQSVPTLVPPTPIPVSEPLVSDFVPSESAIVRIVRDGRVRVGVLFNEPPFGEFTVRGEVRGFDADLARRIAESWGVELDLVQVTRQNGIEMLKLGEVDLLIAAQVHRREMASVVEFSHTYRVGRQAILVRNDNPAETLFNLLNQRIGVVVGTDSDEALQRWQNERNLTLLTQNFYTLDRALGALFAGEVDGVVGRYEQLLRVAGDGIFNAKVLEEPVELEPFAIAMTRQDVNLRLLVNRTLQYLIQKGTMAELYTTYFQGVAFPIDVTPVWASVGDEAPKPQQYAQNVPFPQQYAVPRILNDKVVRVAGFFVPAVDASEGVKRVHLFHERLLDELAQRWGVRLEFIDGGDVFELLEQGHADVAVGVLLDWSVAQRVDFSQPYMLSGDRLMVKRNSTITGFNELRNRWVGIMHTDTGATERAQEWARSINANIRIYSTFEQDAGAAMLVQNNADAIYGDSIKLIPHLQANPDLLRLTERWYSRNYTGFAVPRNDIDLRLLVDYTLQAMVADGTLNSLLAFVIPPNSEYPQFEIIPGSDTYYGISLR